MSKARVYVETTIPSFYHETRIALEIVTPLELLGGGHEKDSQ